MGFCSLWRTLRTLAFFLPGDGSECRGANMLFNLGRTTCATLRLKLNDRFSMRNFVHIG